MTRTKLIFLSGALILTCGCATKATTEIRDVDGTTYSATSKAGPFAELETTNHRMLYEWTSEGGDLSVGQGAEGLDNTTQTQALKEAIALGRALAPILESLLPYPDGSPNAGGLDE